MLRHASTVVGLCDEVADGRPRDISRVLVQVHGQDVLAYIEVGIVEVIRNVPTEHLELPPLEEDRMEPTEREEQLPVIVHLADTVVALVRRVHQEPHDVRLQPPRRLRRHLDTVLEELNRELWRRGGRQEHAEFLVRAILKHLFDHLLQARKPVDAEVTVCQQNPESLGGAVLQHLRCLGLLALPEGYVAGLRGPGSRQGVQLRRGVHAWCEDEQQRRCA
mmetsp:Transcript_28948/g.91294  ORF Transcript_28948/g.91294 Transcript_28948/m.91294 type:complete len:220 (-) Transcript_28948:198-857(-)